MMILPYSMASRGFGLLNDVRLSSAAWCDLVQDELTGKRQDLQSHRPFTHLWAEAKLNHSTNSD